MSQYDYINAINDYEEGRLDSEGIVTLFRFLEKSELLFNLQGSYVRAWYALKKNGELD